MKLLYGLLIILPLASQLTLAVPAGPIGTDLQNGVGNFTNAADTAASDIGDGIKDIGSGIVNGITGVGKGIVNGVTGIGKAIGNGVKHLGQDAGNIVQTVGYDLTRGLPIYLPEIKLEKVHIPPPTTLPPANTNGGS